MHPQPSEVKAIRADQLQVGMKLYSPNGWHQGPKETNGCWRKVEIIDKESTTTRDMIVTLEKFPGESDHLYEHFDNHTLVMVSADTEVNPVLGAAEKLVSELEKVRQLIKTLPEGALLQVRDRDIQAFGEAMLLDGATTIEANEYILAALTEKYSRVSELLFTYVLFATIPGGENSVALSFLESIICRP